ncbi:hypothetical protein NZK27_09580, partial [Synechococcus sp. FGCU-3]|nr:hypothetical protein [Synechococcus sp. FGCU3]
GYDLYWKNSISGQFALWKLSSSGSLLSGSLLSYTHFLQAETDHQVDLDRDGSTGLTFSPGLTPINDVNLGTTPLGYAISVGSGSPISITWNGGQVASHSNPGAGWLALAAARTNSGYDLYWKNSISGQFALWNLNASGVLTSSRLLSSSLNLNAIDTTAAAAPVISTSAIT